MVGSTFGGRGMYREGLSLVAVVCLSIHSSHIASVVELRHPKTSNILQVVGSHQMLLVLLSAQTHNRLEV